jgi:hypothetical protein
LLVTYTGNKDNKHKKNKYLSKKPSSAGTRFFVQSLRETIVQKTLEALLTPPPPPSPRIRDGQEIKIRIRDAGFGIFLTLEPG